jgi:Domain of unknown function (DUF222)/HNH endonuclease
METQAVHAMVDRVAGLARTGATRAALTAAAVDAAALRRWLDGVDVTIAAGLAAVCDFPEQSLATAGRLSLLGAAKVVERSKTAEQAPEFGTAITEGRISAGHVDVLGKALRTVPEHVQARLLDRAGALAEVAGACTVDQFAKRLRQEASRLLSHSDREARLIAQRSQVRLNTWTDQVTGMGHWSAMWDPETMLILEAELDAMVERLFHAEHPDDAPTDPVEKQRFLRAHALLALLKGGGAKMARPELTIVARPRDDGTAIIDYPLPVELPPSVIERHCRQAEIAVVVIDDGEIVAAPGRLNLGRSQRLANRDQRRALAARYRTCAVPSCATAVAKTEAHHIVPFEDGGLTDLDNLVPICKHHHDLIPRTALATPAGAGARPRDRVARRNHHAQCAR